MENDTQWDLRRKKLCFTFQEPWVPGHKCSGKGKAYHIEAYFDSGEDEDYRDQEQDETSETVDEGQASGGTIANMTGVPRFHTLQIRGTVQGHRVGVLIDGGASHNFIDATWVKRRHSN